MMSSMVIFLLAITPVVHASDKFDLHDEAECVVSRHKATFLEPPRHIPHDTSVDAPLLGNGDMGVAIGGLPEKQTFWLSKNDFWRLKSQYGTSGPRVFGHIELDMPALKGATYLVKQYLHEPVTVSAFTKGKTTLTMRSWVAATANVLVVELMTSGGSVETTVHLRVAENDQSEKRSYCPPSNEEFPTIWATREFSKGVDIPVEAACAMRLQHTKGSIFRLDPGVPVRLVVALASSFKCDDPLAESKRLCGSAWSGDGSKHLWKDHCAWWHAFWAKSFVEIADQDIMRHYYLSNYVMASCSRDPEFPPPIFGTWITTDRPGWAGDYHLNYNHMAPYYGLYSSNHIEQADPYHAPILAFMDRAKWYSKKVHGYRGVLYPVGIGPKGIETTRNSPHGKHVQEGGLFFGQKSNAAYGVVNMTMRWRLTYDIDYARTVYPYVREVVDFWEDALTFEGGRYVVHGDSVHEGSGTDFNSIVTLGLVRNAIETVIDMSASLGVDDDRHEKWRHILDHLSGFATQQRGGRTVFRYTEKGTDWWRDNTLGIQHIYPAGAIGLDSDPELLRVARNTIDVMNRWIDNNGMNSFFPAAVRVGYDPVVILKRLHDYVVKHARPNGFAAHNPHGIENCSIVPNTVNEMLCMGHRGVLRVFPVWPRMRDARFGNIRADGAFLVSSAIESGDTQYVRILSERGRDCTLQNAWPGKAIVLYRNGRKTETRQGSRFTFPTAAGESLLLGPSGLTFNELESRIARVPLDMPTITPTGR